MCQLADALSRAGQIERAQAELQRAKELGSCDAVQGKAH
jgi:hypothetical protein